LTFGALPSPERSEDNPAPTAGFLTPALAANIAKDAANYEAVKHSVANQVPQGAPPLGSQCKVRMNLLAASLAKKLPKGAFICASSGFFPEGVADCEACSCDVCGGQVTKLAVISLGATMETYQDNIGTTRTFLNTHSGVVVMCSLTCAINVYMTLPQDVTPREVQVTSGAKRKAADATLPLAEVTVMLPDPCELEIERIKEVFPGKEPTEVHARIMLAMPSPLVMLASLAESSWMGEGMWKSLPEVMAASGKAVSVALQGRQAGPGRENTAYVHVLPHPEEGFSMEDIQQLRAWCCTGTSYYINKADLRLMSRTDIRLSLCDGDHTAAQWAFDDWEATRRWRC
jgi:hypothetical protein